MRLRPTNNTPISSNPPKIQTASKEPQETPTESNTSPTETENTSFSKMSEEQDKHIQRLAQQPSPKKSAAGAYGKKTTSASSQPTTSPKATATTNSTSPSNALGIAADSLDLAGKSMIETKEKVLEFFTKGLGIKSKELDGMLSALGKTKAGMNVLKSFLEAANEAKQGNTLKMLAKSLAAMGEAWDTLPDKLQATFTKNIKSTLSKIKPLKSFANILGSMNDVQAMGSVCKALSSLLEGNTAGFTKELKDVFKKIKDSKEPHRSKALYNLTKGMLGLLPMRKRIKLGFKALARKIPLFGTAAVLVLDIAQLIQKGTKDKKAWAGLMSTLAGAIPVVGTAGSAIIDLGIVIAEVASTSDKISKSLKNARPKLSPG